MFGNSEALTLAVVIGSGALAAAVIGLVVAYARLHEAVQRVRDHESQQEGISARLRENEYRLRAIIESEPECMKLQAANGTVLEINPAGLALVEADAPGDIIGKPIYLLVAPEHRGVYRDHVRRVFEGESVVYEFRLVTIKGRSRWMETHAAPLRDAQGGIHALLAITRDITERKLAEERVRRHQIEIARVARLSTMGEMAAALAHELNQPLSAIAAFARGCTRRLRAGTATLQDLGEPLDAIGEQAERAGEVIRHVREFVRRRELVLGPADVNQIARSVAHFADIDARQHEAVLRLELAPRLPPAVADPIMVEQVIGNLVRNAIDAMTEARSPRREITLRTAQRDGAVEVEVADTGPGIDAAVVQQVFEPFFTTKHDGVGMGLSISRSIVEAHGGRIGVDSVIGRGASFRFSLPLAAQEVHRGGQRHGLHR
ncbi:MAG: PAS domain S-box protein [Ideonella sp.]|nr:MAG: PAS domain S-box protein [Burkholderiaceae bacterium]MBE7426507.1 PAS domain S-box protein [Ideonella sp.]MCC7459611.1 PAS domain S-box protein [Nitrospira sp.]